MAPPVLKLPLNTKGRDFVVGDIHGAFDLLDQALLAVGFDPEKDRLIAVGDLVNRGSRSADCLYYLAQPWFYSIRGNHEEIFIRVHRGEKLKDADAVKKIPQGFAWMLKETAETMADICSAFEKLPIAIEVETPEGPVGFVHADVPQGMDWDTFKQKLEAGDKSVRQTAIWSRERLSTMNQGGVSGAVRVFFGHTTVEGGPQALGNCFFIDTGAVFGQMDEKNPRDLYLAIIDIKSAAEDIVKPAPTKEKLVRTVVDRENKKPSKPHTPKNDGPKV